MADIINLRSVRKVHRRELAEREAAEQRERHGMPKAARDLHDAREAQQRRQLDACRLERGDEE